MKEKNPKICSIKSIDRMSENHSIQCSMKRKRDETPAVETKSTIIRRVTTTAADDGGINQLSDDALFCVFEFFRWEDLMNAGLVSRRWERLCKRVCSSLRVLDYNWDTMFTVPQARCSSPLVECPSSNNSASSSSLPFYCPDFEDRFFTCVERTMNNHGANAHISSFNFEFCVGKWSTASTALLDHWISCALNKGASELSLKYMCKYQCILKRRKIYGHTPCVLSKFEQVAKLKSLSLNTCAIPEGTVPQMPCLKSLRLVWVKLGVDDLNSFLSGCRNLESIHLQGSNLPLTLFIPDSLTQLKCIRIVLPPRWSRIVISAPNLHTFSNLGASIMLSFHKVSCLNKMCLELLEPREEHVRYLFGQAAGENAMLERLILAFYTCNKQVINMPDRITRFNQLKRLGIYAYMDLRLNVQKIVNILDACPLLEMFNLVTVTLKEDETIVHREYIYKHLKKVRISRISYTGNYLKLATHLLEHSITLEKMILGRELPYHRRSDLAMIDQMFLSNKADRTKSRRGALYKIFREKLLAHRKSYLVSFTF